MVRRRKEIADQLDVTLMLNFLWCYDKYHFRHPRRRPELSLILLFLIYTGARPGSIVKSSAYQGSNDALFYKVSHRNCIVVAGILTATGLRVDRPARIR